MNFEYQKTRHQAFLATFLLGQLAMSLVGCLNIKTKSQSAVSTVDGQELSYGTFRSAVTAAKKFLGQKITDKTPKETKSLLVYQVVERLIGQVGAIKSWEVQAFLVQLLDDDGGDCGGKSCSQLLGYTRREIPKMVDQWYEDTSPANSKNCHIRYLDALRQSFFRADAEKALDGKESLNPKLSFDWSESYFSPWKPTWVTEVLGADQVAIQSASQFKDFKRLQFFSNLKKMEISKLRDQLDMEEFAEVFPHITELTIKYERKDRDLYRSIFRALPKLASLKRLSISESGVTSTAPLSIPEDLAPLPQKLEEVFHKCGGGGIFPSEFFGVYASAKTMIIKNCTINSLERMTALNGLRTIGWQGLHLIGSRGVGQDGASPVELRVPPRFQNIRYIDIAESLNDDSSGGTPPRGPELRLNPDDHKWLMVKTVKPKTTP